MVNNRNQSVIFMQKNTNIYIYNYHKSSSQEKSWRQFDFINWLNSPKEAKRFINVERALLESKVIHDSLVNIENSSEFSTLPSNSISGRKRMVWCICLVITYHKCYKLCLCFNPGICLSLFLICKILKGRAMSACWRMESRVEFPSLRQIVPTACCVQGNMLQ